MIARKGIVTAMRKPNHYKDPLRKIVKREDHNGKPFVVMVCGHSAPGKPASRQSRFYPCVVCAEKVAYYRNLHGRLGMAR